MPHVVTANRTSNGAAVYLGPTRVWTSSLARSLVVDDPNEVDAVLAWARRQERDVCDPYAMAVDVTDGRVEATSARERIRAGGAAPVLERLGLAR